MAWGKREKIHPNEARQLGLLHVRDQDNVYASPSRKSVVIDNGYPTGFTRTKQGWKAHLYDDQMGGHLVRRPAAEAQPYEDYLRGTHGITPPAFTDRRGQRETESPCIGCAGSGEMSSRSGSRTRTCEHCGGSGVN